VGPDGAVVLLIQTPGSQLSTYFRIVGSEIGTSRPRGVRCAERVHARELRDSILGAARMTPLRIDERLG